MAAEGGKATQDLRTEAVKRSFALVLIASGVAVAACSKVEPQACQPPRSYWEKPHNFLGLVPLMDDVSLTHDGSIYWNGVRISSARFGEYLTKTHTMNPEPTVFLETEMGVSCSALEAVRDQMEQALECKKAYSSCAEGIQRVWRDLPVPPGAPVS